ncbi:MAG: helix-turn-helix domain-containing protein, partial [Halobacteriales archaeon]
MKRLRVRLAPDPAAAPRAFSLIADSERIEETRLLEWNVGEDGRPTLLFTVEGDWAGLPDQLRAAPSIAQITANGITEEQAVLLVTLRPSASPLAAAVFETLTSSGLVIDTPVVYREGTVRVTLLGESGVLQDALDGVPDTVSVDVREVGRVSGPGPAAVLSDRQREAVAAGLELGYYDVPRGATHEDVAERLGCSPSTASEHLQKAEAKLVRAAMDD